MNETEPGRTGEHRKRRTSRRNPRPSSPLRAQAADATPEPAREPFPIVGIGASAGGLEAVTDLLRHLPTDTGMAFVFVQHLDPTHESLLGALLAKTTTMPVVQVSEGSIVQPDHVYVIPPNVDMTISAGILRLKPRSEVRGQHMPVDGFLRSLARDQKSRAIGIILSGTASDGAAGMREIKAEGGITFAQSEDSARHGGMPHSAVAAGAVDFILPPERIALELSRIVRHPYVRATAPVGEDVLEENKGVLDRIFLALRRASGVNFALYKKNTIQRRLKRRMVLHRMERLEDYLSFMKDRPQEVQELYEDLLIDVTGFFRDPQAFEALKTIVFPNILRTRTEEGSLRAWVPGCSTGEEAYSIAIGLTDFLGDRMPGVAVQIFATDVSDSAIEAARSGIYRENILTDVPPDRLRRFFTKVDRGYQVSKSIRDLCIFARQDLTRDPPFSRLDLISCRNVLIYLETALQKQVMPIFHYALKPTGFLWLGSSESIGTFAELFTAVDHKHRIYARRATPSRLDLSFVSNEYAVVKADVGEAVARAGRGPDLFREADRVVMARYAPASVLINEDLEILQFRGQTGGYLDPAPGQASLNLLRMAREGLALHLRAAVQKARKRGEPTRIEGIALRREGKSRTIGIEVIPLKLEPSAQRFFLVIFEEAPRSRSAGIVKKAPRETGPARDHGAARLRRELAAARDYLQAIVEEQEATNEELKSANEEILSANEELQSTNEELQTSKEEIQSANEELSTLNEELQNRNTELGQTNNDLTNVLNSVNIAMVILEPDLRIRRFTPMAEKVLNLIPGDVGRRITDIKPNVAVPDLEGLIVEVMDSVSVRERAVQDGEGRWYSLRIRPYKTTDNRIHGAVLAFVDIDDLERSRQRLQESENLAQAIVETVREGLLVLDRELRVKKANRTFYEMFQVPAGETEGRPLHELGRGQWNIPHVLEKLRGVTVANTGFEDLEVTAEFPGLGRKTMVISARGVERGGDLTNTMLVAVRDISRRKRTELIVKELSGRLLQLRDEEQRRIARELHDSTAQSLSALAMNLALAEKYAEDLPPRARAALAESRSLAEGCARELHDLAALLHPPLLDEIGLLSAVKWFAETFARRTGIQVKLESSIEPGMLPIEIRTTLFRIVQETLTNIQRHSGSPSAWIRIERVPFGVEVSVRDEGRGIQDQGHSVDSIPAGVGIIGMQERVRQVGGVLDIASGTGGTTVKVRIPLPADAS